MLIANIAYRFHSDRVSLCEKLSALSCVLPFLRLQLRGRDRRRAVTEAPGADHHRCGSAAVPMGWRTPMTGAVSTLTPAPASLKLSERSGHDNGETAGNV
jgi:hypothetical protein